MSAELFISEILNGFTKGMVQGQGLRLQGEKQKQEAGFRQQEIDIKRKLSERPVGAGSVAGSIQVSREVSTLRKQAADMQAAGDAAGAQQINSQADLLEGTLTAKSKTSSEALKRADILLKQAQSLTDPTERANFLNNPEVVANIDSVFGAGFAQSSLGGGSKEEFEQAGKVGLVEARGIETRGTELVKQAGVIGIEQVRQEGRESLEGVKADFKEQLAELEEGRSKQRLKTVFKRKLQLEDKKIKARENLELLKDKLKKKADKTGGLVGKELTKVLIQGRKDLVRDPSMLQLSKQLSNLNAASKLNELQAAGNTLATGALKFKLPRALGEVGPLTKTDQSLATTSGQIPRKVVDNWQLFVEGKPTDMTIGEIKQMLNFIKGSLSRDINNFTDDYIGAHSNLLGIPEDKLREKWRIRRIKGAIAGAAPVRSVPKEDPLKAKRDRLKQLLRGQ